MTNWRLMKWILMINIILLLNDNNEMKIMNNID